MSKKIRIGDARPSELPFIADLQRRLKLPGAELYTSAEHEAGLCEWLAASRSGHPVLIAVARLGGTPAGYVLCVPVTGDGLHPARDYALIDHLVVAEKFEGRGVGTELLQYATSWATKQHFLGLIAQLRPHNSPWYVANGFRDCGSGMSVAWVADDKLPRTRRTTTQVSAGFDRLALRILRPSASVTWTFADPLDDDIAATRIAARALAETLRDQREQVSPAALPYARHLLSEWNKRLGPLTVDDAVKRAHS